MTERQVNERRNWKAETFPYDYFFPDETTECQYCLTDKQAELLRGLLQPIGWNTRWWSDEDTTIDIDTIEAFRDDIIRRLMMSCCGDEAPIQFRWTIDGILQKSTDGGETWEDAPELDPRNNSPQFPPVPGEPSFDKRCIAATGMSTLIKAQVGDNLTDDMSQFTLQEVIETWVTTMINTSNPFQALIVIAATQIFALIISVLRAALTDTVYDQLTCIFYCRMEGDLSFTASGVENVTSDIGDQIGGVATLFLQQLVNLLGVVGMTNLARAGGATEGDCSDCEECLTCNQQWEIFGAGHGTDLVITADYVEVTGTDPGNGNYYAILKTPDASSCCAVDHVDTLSGSFTLHGWTDCGQTQSEGAPQHTGLGWGDCINYFQAQSTSPFTIRIFFVECP